MRPPRNYLLKNREIGVHFYLVQSTVMLKREYVGHNEEGFYKLTKELREDIERKFNATEEFSNYSDFWLHLEWLDKQGTSLTTNIVAEWC